MISFLRGRLTEKKPTQVVLDVGGVGYSANIPLSTFEKLGAPGEDCTILTYLWVKNEKMELYGFATEAERELFSALISVSGIGAKSAITILSGPTVKELKSAITGGDSLFLSSIRGVGRKKAERLIVELRDKLCDYEEVKRGIPKDLCQEAVSALISLGFNRREAEGTVRKVLKQREDITLEELVRETLKTL